MTSWFRRYVLPGLVFQSIIIGGGYATGRELIEFFLRVGPVGGLMAMAVTALVWSAVLAASFELARVTASYDYRSFFIQLLGRGWVAYEAAYLMLLVVVLAVLGAASGEIAAALLGWPRIAGTLALVALVGGLVLCGNAAVARALAGAALLLYAVYAVAIVWSLLAFGERIGASFTGAPVGADWARAGLIYAGYNVAVIPAVFFCIRGLEHRREAVGAGLLAGPIAMLPGVLFFIAMMAFYPQIGDQPVPSSYLLAQLQAPWFHYVFQAAVFLTLVATGTALIHAINERIARSFAERGRGMPRALRPALAVAIMALSVFAATTIGLVDLIARGYGALAWVFIAVLVVPVLTIGIWKIRRLGAAPAAASRVKVSAT
jgi:uncharacterized membrane protein YkvI